MAGDDMLEKTIDKAMDKAAEGATSAISSWWKIRNSPERVRARIYSRALRLELKIKWWEWSRKKKVKRLMEDGELNDVIQSGKPEVQVSWPKFTEKIEAYKLNKSMLSFHSFWRRVHRIMLNIEGFREEAAVISQEIESEDTSEARAKLNRTLKRLESIPDPREEVDVLLALAFYDVKDKKYTEAIRNCEKALKAAVGIENQEWREMLMKRSNSRFVDYLDRYGRILIAEGSHGAAEEVLQEAEQAALILSDDKLLLAVRSNIAFLRSAQSELAKRGGFIEQAEQQLEGAFLSKRQWERAEKLVAYMPVEDKGKMLGLLRLEGLGVAKDVESDAKALGELGLLSVRHCRFDEARRYFEKAMNGWLAEGAWKTAGDFANEIAEVNDELGAEMKSYLASRLK